MLSLPCNAKISRGYRGQNLGSLLTEVRSDRARTGGGSTFWKKKCTVGPNELFFFFPVKLQLNPDFSAEISTGNTSEISTSESPKSANLAFFGLFLRIAPGGQKNVQEISDGNKFSSQIC